MISRLPHSKRPGGFSLIEVMAAVLLLGIAMTYLLQLRSEAVARAAVARNLSISSRLARDLLARIRAGRVADLFDGYTGDFSEEGFPDIRYVLGIGDGSIYASGTNEESQSEQIWRQSKEDQYQEEQDKDQKPPYTRLFLTVEYPDQKGETEKFSLETVVETWAIEQDFELFQEKWGKNLPAEEN